MLRTIAAVVLGYIATAVWIMLTLSLAWLVLGPERGFKPGTTEVTAAWLAVNLPLSLIGALLGGYVAACIAPSPRGTAYKALAAMILVLGLLMAFLQIGTEAPAATAPADLGTFEAASKARQPSWYSFTVPLVGCVGVLMGGALRRRQLGE